MWIAKQLNDGSTLIQSRVRASRWLLTPCGERFHLWREGTLQLFDRTRVECVDYIEKAA